ncbi:MAG: hypothetical protein PHT07_09930 [Paludibacter sp.]|nr:hypothetical protein [Paludibacter sp.]
MSIDKRSGCYGAKKEEVIHNYFLQPIAQIKLLDGQRKIGCCGEVKDRYFIFSYTGIQDRNDRGTFFVGYDCAEQMIDKINQIKQKKQGAELITAPHLFDPDTAEFSKPISGITKMNHAVARIILLLASYWNVDSFYGIPVILLGKIMRHPEQDLTKEEILNMDKIVSRCSDEALDFLKQHNHDYYLKEVEKIRG